MALKGKHFLPDDYLLGHIYSNQSFNDETNRLLVAICLGLVQENLQDTKQFVARTRVAESPLIDKPVEQQRAASN